MNYKIKIGINIINILKLTMMTTMMKKRRKKMKNCRISEFMDWRKMRVETFA